MNHNEKKVVLLPVLLIGSLRSDTPKYCITAVELHLATVPHVGLTFTCARATLHRYCVVTGRCGYRQAVAGLRRSCGTSDAHSTALSSSLAMYS